MQQVDVRIEGIVPILFHRYTEEAGKAGGGRLSVEEYRQKAREAVYRNGHGLFCPAANIKRAMRFGAGMANLKVGRRGADAYLNSLMFIDPREVLFGKDEPDFIHEAVGRIPPGPKGARVMIYRAGINEGWQLEFRIQVFDDALSLNLVKQSLETAGLMVGLCDYRPEYGRFQVIKWDQGKKKGK